MVELFKKRPSAMTDEEEKIVKLLEKYIPKSEVRSGCGLKQSETIFVGFLSKTNEKDEYLFVSVGNPPEEELSIFIVVKKTPETDAATIKSITDVWLWRFALLDKPDMVLFEKKERDFSKEFQKYLLNLFAEYTASKKTKSSEKLRIEKIQKLIES